MLLLMCSHQFLVRYLGSLGLTDGSVEQARQYVRDNPRFTVYPGGGVDVYAGIDPGDKTELHTES